VRQLPEPFGYIVDGAIDGPRFKKGLDDFDRWMRSTMPVFNYAQMQNAIASVKRDSLSEGNLLDIAQSQLQFTGRISLTCASGANSKGLPTVVYRDLARAIEAAHGIAEGGAQKRSQSAPKPYRI